MKGNDGDYYRPLETEGSGYEAWNWDFLLLHKALDFGFVSFPAKLQCTNSFRFGSVAW